MTPWAELLLAPPSSDDQIRARFHALSRDQHPDRDGADGVPGERWYVLTTAYTALKTAQARSQWKRRQANLSGMCKTCSGFGTTERLLGKDKGVSVCTVCAGAGRVK